MADRAAVPSALGAIAALTEFVPYLGPILAAIPALLVAVTGGFDQVIWTLAAYILIHQVEGNLIMPQIQKRMVYIPPALTLLGIAAMGALAGLLGFVFAAPIMVAIFVVVQKAYVHDTLKEDITLPGEKILLYPAKRDKRRRFKEADQPMFMHIAGPVFPATQYRLSSVQRIAYRASHDG